MCRKRVDGREVLTHQLYRVAASQDNKQPQRTVMKHTRMQTSYLVFGVGLCSSPPLPEIMRSDAVLLLALCVVCSTSNTTAVTPRSGFAQHTPQYARTCMRRAFTCARLCAPFSSIGRVRRAALRSLSYLVYRRRPRTRCVQDRVLWAAAMSVVLARSRFSGVVLVLRWTGLMRSRCNNCCCIYGQQKLPR